MPIHMPSVWKAGGIAAAIAIVLGLLSAIPVLGAIAGLFLCLGGFLIPILAGIGYGYFAPGKETMGASAAGGALAGGAAGLLFAIVQGVVGAVIVGTSPDGGIAEGIAAGTIGVLFLICGLGFAGLLFGAIGGVLWPLLQGNRAV